MEIKPGAKNFIMVLIAVSAILFLRELFFSSALLPTISNFILVLVLIFTYKLTTKYIYIQEQFKNQVDLVEQRESEVLEQQQALADREKAIEELESEVAEKMEKARNLHRKLLPDNIPEPGDLFISSYYQPAEYMGGDYYNVFQIDHGKMASFFQHYLVYYFDVAGHGLDSTLLAIFINETIANYFNLKHNAGEKVSPGELLNYVDQQYQKEGFPENYIVCLFLGLLDLNNYKMTYATAGLQFPVFAVKSSSEEEENPAQSNKVSELATGELPLSTGLGAIPDRPEKSFEITPDTNYFLGTDGILEQQGDSELYYEDKFNRVLHNYGHLPPAFLKDMLLADFANFRNHEPAGDDVTFLLLGRPQGKRKEWELDCSQEDEEMIENLRDFIVTNDDNLKAKKPESAKLSALSETLLDIIKNYREQEEECSLTVRGLKNSRYYFFKLQSERKNFSWREDIINEDRNLANRLSFLKEIKEKSPGELSQLTAGEIYASYDYFSNKINLLMKF